MRLSLFALSIVSASLVFAGANAAADESSYYLDLVNASPDSLQTLAIGATDGSHYQVVPFADGALQGGGTTATVRIRSDAADCLRNIRLTFVTGYTLVQRDFNVCHRQRLTVKRSRSDETRTASMSKLP
jgi:hypothetical protein